MAALDGGAKRPLALALVLPSISAVLLPETDAGLYANKFESRSAAAL